MYHWCYHRHDLIIIIVYLSGTNSRTTVGPLRNILCPSRLVSWRFVFYFWQLTTDFSPRRFIVCNLAVYNFFVCLYTSLSLSLIIPHAGSFTSLSLSSPSVSRLSLSFSRLSIHYSVRLSFWLSVSAPSVLSLLHYSWKNICNLLTV